MTKIFLTLFSFFTDLYDYVSIVSTVVFNNSSPSKQCVSIPLLDDQRPEPTKSFNILLITDHLTTIVGRDKAIVMIQDNDGTYVSYMSRIAIEIP